MKLGPITVLQL